jgi:hypothetical protein
VAESVNDWFLDREGFARGGGPDFWTDPRDHRRSDAPERWESAGTSESEGPLGTDWKPLSTVARQQLAVSAIRLAQAHPHLNDQGLAQELMGRHPSTPIPEIIHATAQPGLPAKQRLCLEGAVDLLRRHGIREQAELLAALHRAGIALSDGDSDRLSTLCDGDYQNRPTQRHQPMSSLTPPRRRTPLHLAN